MSTETDANESVEFLSSEDSSIADNTTQPLLLEDPTTSTDGIHSRGGMLHSEDIFPL